MDSDQSCITNLHCKNHSAICWLLAFGGLCSLSILLVDTADSSRFCYRCHHFPPCQLHSVPFCARLFCFIQDVWNQSHIRVFSFMRQCLLTVTQSVIDIQSGPKKWQHCINFAILKLIPCYHFFGPLCTLQLHRLSKIAYVVACGLWNVQCKQ